MHDYGTTDSTLASLNLRNWFRHRYNLPRRQQLGLVMTRSGRVSGYPLGNSVDAPHMETHTAQSIHKDSELMDSDATVGEGRVRFSSNACVSESLS